MNNAKSKNKKLTNTESVIILATALDVARQVFNNGEKSKLEFSVKQNKLLAKPAPVSCSHKSYPFECIVCHKKFIVKEWLETKGVLKGMKIISSVTCSKKCEDWLQEDLKNHGKE